MIYATRHMVRLVIMILSLTVIWPTISEASARRIYSQRVQSEEPLVVAKNFVEAWKRNDFYETWQLLTPDTKSKFFQNIATTYSFKGILNLKNDASILSGAKFWGERELTQKERSDFEMDHGLQFDDVMYAGSKLNALPFKFGPEYKITLLENNKLKSVVTVVTDGHPLILKIKMQKNNKDNNFRIDQISWEGSDLNAYPWGIIFSH
ncbi:hypothetical protein [Citrobacter sp. S-77]|uniref:hypothetical protein n=1 Tax=Citrobacter sp. S-77 TaxID=1080067 RepID=UPI0005EFF6AB|nr:hypothetical protein [Citrobacter sp. S-77]